MKKCYAATCKVASQVRALRAEKSQRESQREPERTSESLREQERARESRREPRREPQRTRKSRERRFTRHYISFQKRGWFVPRHLNMALFVTKMSFTC